MSEYKAANILIYGNHAIVFPSKMKSFDRISRQQCESLIDLFINKVVNSYNRLLQVFTMYLDQQLR